MDIDCNKNHDEFVSLLRASKRPGIEQLIKYLESTDFFTAPCSTKYHLSKEGGLCQHSLNVFDAANLFSAAYQFPGVNEERYIPFDDMNVLIASLLHDICKANTYKKELRWRKDESNQWEQYETYSFDEEYAFGHSEKSVYIASKFIKLTDVEAQAINGHMGFSDSRGLQLIGNIFKQNSLALLLHSADMYATYIIENERVNLDEK